MSKIKGLTNLISIRNLVHPVQLGSRVGQLALNLRQLTPGLTDVDVRRLALDLLQLGAQRRNQLVGHPVV
jgi:hypothetical protein